MAEKASRIVGFSQPFPDRDADELARKLTVLDTIALAELTERLPKALRNRDPQQMENALKDVREGLPDPTRFRATAIAIAKTVNRRNRDQFFTAVARSTGLDLINTDEPEEIHMGLFSARITQPLGKPAMVKVNLNPGLFVEQFARQTTSRITTLSDGVIDGTRDAIVREVMLGTGDPEVLTQQLLRKWKKEGVPSKIPTRRRTQAGLPVHVNVEAHAAFIARDQIGTLQMELTRARQTQAGITRFVWRTRRDSRVRPSHAARNGRSFTWVDGADGEFPGGPPNCRCRSSAVVDPKVVAESLARP